jgi:glyoxylase I family protein
VQYYNRHFGFVLRPAKRLQPHEPLAPGLHHLCFRVEDQAAIETVARRFAGLGIQCSNPQLYLEYAPDYWAVFFEDPDGIRLEVTNYRAERKRRFNEWPNC